MRKHKILITLAFCATVAIMPTHAQLSKITGGLLGSDKEELAEIKEEGKTRSDSQTIAELKEQIEQLKLNEIGYIFELEKTRNVLASDSLREKRQKEIIDSMKQINKGMPLVIEGDTIHYFYTSKGGVSISDRIINTEHNIRVLGKKRNVNPDSIYLYKLEGGKQIEIMYANKVITSVLKDDALWMDMTIDSLAKIERAAIVDAVKILQKRNSILQILKRIGLFVLVVIMQSVFIYITNWAHKKAKFKIGRYAQNKIKPIAIKGYELLTVKRLTQFIMFVFSILRYLIILIQLIITIPILFSIFPQTKSFAMTLFGYIFLPLKSIFLSVINYIPNLFTIIIIYYLVKYMIKGIKFLASEIETERLKIPGFYPDWAMPTFNIIRFLLYAFMIAMIYPYLPGSSSGVFQGISVFVGIIVSLGSSAAIGNIVAGLVITYMRPYKVGDKIKLNDTVGNVIEKTLFVTRLKTSQNEVITIPNSAILSSQTTNFSLSARDYGLIVHSNVAIGYEVPWQTAHEILIKAAKATKGIIEDKDPFVLDLGLEDYYNNYQINVYIDDANKAANIITQLNSNIQDIFLQEGIEIESPLLISERKELPRYKKKDE